MKTSRRGVEMIAGFEGFVGRAYRPVPTETYWTIGFGHYGADVRANATISRQSALELLARDVARFEAAVTRLGGRFTQGQFDALVSLAFNCGEGSLQGGIAQAVRGGHYNQIPTIMRKFVHAGGRVLPGLVRRRETEIALFLSQAPTHHVDPLDGLTPSERRWCQEYDRLKARNVDLSRRRVLRRVLTAQRKRIWHAAQRSGWDKAHRRDRYRSLLARTT